MNTDSPRSVVPHRYRDQARARSERRHLRRVRDHHVEVGEPVDHIVLNAAELDLKSVSLRAGGETIPAEVELDEKLQRATLRFPRTIEPGEADLDIEFSGVLNDQLHGFYRSTFTDVRRGGADDRHHPVRGDRRPAGISLLGRARLQGGLPGHDGRPRRPVRGFEHMEESRQPAGEERSRCGSPTPWSCRPIWWHSSSGPFEATEPVDVDGIPVRVVAPRGKLHLAPFRSWSAPSFCLRYLRDYYGIPYPGDKVDHLAIPDFAFGAMENLGCITYREAALLASMPEARPRRR